MRDRAILIPVRGRSMLPTVAEGSVVEVRLCTADEARPGDVVLTLSPEGGTTVLHRLISRRGNTLVTQGDALRWPDPPLPQDRMLGVAVLPRRPLLAGFRRLRFRLRAMARSLLLQR